MIPIVNHKYRYIMFYSAKVASSALRELFLDLHHDEGEAQAGVNRYNRLSEEFRAKPKQDCSDYYSFLITRNPFSRIVSSYLDQYVFAGKSLGAEFSATHSEPVTDRLTFKAFLKALKNIPDAARDSHFQTQSFTESRVGNGRFTADGLDYVGDLAKLNWHLREIYQAVFATDPKKLAHLNKITEVSSKKRNSIYYSAERFTAAAVLEPRELEQMVCAPKPQDFYIDQEVVSLVQEIYAADFTNYGYDLTTIPESNASEDLKNLPDDFLWNIYLELNPDLGIAGITSERALVRHFLEFGRFETDPARAHRLDPPSGFEWLRYLQKKPDLRSNGVNDERSAVVHYLGFGIREGRKF